MNRLVPALAMFCVATLSGCHPVRSAVPFDVAARNVGPEELASVRIEFEGFWHSMGFLSPGGGGSRYSLFEGHWPEAATIKWRLDSDRPYMLDREVKISIPLRPDQTPQEKLTLWFDLDGNGVVVRLEKRDYGWIYEHIRKKEEAEKRKPAN